MVRYAKASEPFDWLEGFMDVLSSFFVTDDVDDVSVDDVDDVEDVSDDDDVDDDDDDVDDIDVGSTGGKRVGARCSIFVSASHFVVGGHSITVLVQCAKKVLFCSHD